MLELETNIKIKKRNFKNFITNEWSAIFTEFQRVLCLTPEEIAKMQNHNTTHLIAYIPYIAGCNDYQRIAIAELGINCIATRSAIFEHKSDETILHRVEILTSFPGGDENAKRAGTILLALISISDHKKDLNDDIQENKFNPLLSMTLNELAVLEKALWDEFNALTADKDYDWDFFTKCVNYSWWS